MQIGTIVKYLADNDLGIIVDKDEFGAYRVKWNDGCEDWHIQSELEVVCE